ncbi:MAG: radical SAM protein [Candidatus Omnitrophota bacterium]|nr:radical SAM protein [Candidatus Omnitrophota bacterium]
MKTEEEKSYPEILFLFPGFKEEDFLDFILTYHLGVGYILAYLKNKGIVAKQFIHKEPIGLYDLTKIILRQKSRIVGFTCYDTNYYLVKLITQLLKKEDPGLNILVGGPTATFSDELIMRDNPAIDICVRGEGEYTVYELVRRLKTSQDVSDILGITYRSNGSLIRNSDRPLIKREKKGEELDILPSPYLNGIFPTDEQFGILTSRGCIFKCVYCNFSAMSRWTIRYHSVERVISELKAISNGIGSDYKETEDRFVRIHDDVFSLNIERAKKICRRIIEEKIILSFWAETRADRVDKELLSLMQKAGFQEINFGLESATPRVLNIIKKVKETHINKNNLILEKRFIGKVRKNVRLAKEIGINPTVSVITGLPGATIVDEKKTMEFVRQLKLHAYHHNYLKISPGTELFETHRNYGLAISHPLTILPYLINYAYDIFKIPRLKNSYSELNKKNHLEKLMRIITGDYEDSRVISYPDLLLKNGSLDSKIIEWINSSISISSLLFFISRNFEDKLARQNIEKLISSNVPTVNFYFLTNINKKFISPANFDFESGKYKIIVAPRLLTDKKEGMSILDTLEFMPFANYTHNCYGRKNDIEKMVFTLFTPEDIESFVGLIPYTNNGALEVMVKSDCYFLDECRWSDKDCPAVTFRRAIIENDGSIIPCFNGKTIAKTDDVREDIIKNLRLLWNDMKKKRGCQSCLVKESCSKCLFPYSLNSKEYCQIRRNKYSNIKDINRVLRLLKIARQQRFFNRNMLQKTKFGRALKAFDIESVIINTARKRCLSS